MRLPELYVFGRYDSRETVFKAGLLQNMEYLVTSRAGCDSQWAASGSCFHGFRGVVEQNRLFCDRLKIIETLASDQVVQLQRRQVATVLGEQRLEAIPIIEGQVFLHVFFISKGEFFLVGNFPECFHVDRIVICKNAIEIENQRTNHSIALG